MKTSHRIRCTSPMRRSDVRLLRVVAFVLLASCACGAIAANDLAATILSDMAHKDSAQTPFIDVNYRGMLDRPLITTGTMKWLGGDQLERDIDKPYQVIAKIGNGQLSVQRAGHPVQTTPISRAPQIAAILTGFRALLGGNITQLSQDFSVSAAGNTSKWVLTMTPRHDELKQRVQSIVIDGRDDQPRCMTMLEADGDTTITLLGAAAKAGLPGVTPQQAAVAALCRNGS